MKKFLFFIFILTILSGTVNAQVTFNVNTTASNSYDPALTTVNVGDIVKIQASGTHPCTQVDQTTWNANGTNPIGGALFSHATSLVTVNISAAMAGTTIYFVCDDHVGTNSMKGRIVVNVVTGIEENVKSDFNFTVYPNPVKNNSFLNISLKKNDNVDLKIFSINGKIVSNYLEQKMNAGDYTLPFSAAKLQTGIYIMQLKTSQGVLRKQILVTH